MAEADRAAGKKASSNNLKQIALAVANLASANNDRLPRNITDNDGKALLSWRVAILSYLEQDALYKEFRLGEAWDSPHNLKLVEKMPKVFESPRVKVRKGYTVYQCFTGGILGSQYGIGNIPDGSSNTIWCSEITAAVPWTKPADASFDAGKALVKTFGKAFDDPLVALCDGSTHRLDLKKLKHKTLLDAIGPDDGFVLGDDW